MTTPADDRDPSRDPSRDPRLLAALRHAPDRDAAPPAAVREAILAQARQAVPPRTPTAPGRLSAWWAALSRPALAGALGTVLIAGVVGLLWRDGPPPAAVPGAEAPTAAEPAAPPPAVPTAAPAPPPQAAPAPEAVRKATPAPAPRQEPGSPPPMAAPAPPMPPPAAADAAPAVVPPVVPQVVPQASPAPVPSMAPAPPPPRAAAAEGAAARAPAAARLAAPPVDPLARALATADGPARERLLALRARVQGSWTEVPPPDAPGDPVRSADGSLLGWLRIDGLTAGWVGIDGRAWRATLAPEAAAPGASR